MPQGIQKNKISLPAGVKQKQKHKKPLGIKKGARDIAPKKKKLQEAVKLKQQLTRTIQNKVEADVMSRATNNEAKPFLITPAPTSSSTKPKKKK